MIRLRRIDLLVWLWIGLMGGCSLFRDPRANCNHPKHEEYVREQHKKALLEGSSKGVRRMSQAQSRASARSKPKPAQSCPNP
ncbi:MAG: hypothetical protein ABDH91_06255 [Bacteroidia bacterium]